METKAKITNISRDFQSGKVQMTFTLDHYESEEVDRLMNKDIRLKAVAWREKRGLTQNSYYWVLVDKMANVTRTTPEELHEILLHRYSTLDLLDDGKPIVITLRADIDIHLLPGHYKAYKQSEDGRFISYMKLKGSSELDTAEFSRLLDGTISDAKEMGVEVLSPDEIERLKMYEVDNPR